MAGRHGGGELTGRSRLVLLGVIHCPAMRNYSRAWGLAGRDHPAEGPRVERSFRHAHEEPPITPAAEAVSSFPPVNIRLDIAGGYLLSRCLYVVADFGVADALGDAPRFVCVWHLRHPRQPLRSHGGVAIDALRPSPIVRHPEERQAEHAHEAAHRDARQILRAIRTASPTASPARIRSTRRSI